MYIFTFLKMWIKTEGYVSRDWYRWPEGSLVSSNFFKMYKLEKKTFL
jgi:hypothetical protein